MSYDYIDDSGLYETPEYKAFCDKADMLYLSGKTITSGQFLAMGAEAIALKKKPPELRADIAYEMVCVGSWIEEGQNVGIVTEIQSLFMGLEIPDEHVYVGDGLSVQQQWDRLELLLKQAQF